MKQLGRLRKAQGDVCLLAGCPRDALEHYTTGLESAKSAADLVWQVWWALRELFAVWAGLVSLLSGSWGFFGFVVGGYRTTIGVKPPI